MAALRFTATMLIRDANPYVPVSAAQAARLKPGWRRPMPVLVRVDGKPEEAWRINLMPAGDGNFYLYLHGTVRKASGTGVGDRVRIELAFDDSYRNGPMHPMPTWFKAALAKEAKAARAWKALTPSRQKEILRYLASLKSAEAKQRNLAKAMRVLGGKPERFMARSWKGGA
ncbi:MAG: hypothetical protein QOJ26_798 [Thermoplasmata archaeon]|jgi:hypothetical protein|nr:hypothetical protein [Thermoplasmata archaeon]